jgi:hypothetical protein
VDSTTLYAAGAYDEGGKFPVVAWSESGVGARRAFPASADTIMSLKALPDGGLFVASQDPYVAVLDKHGSERWAMRPHQADLRLQHSTLAVSADGKIVDFGYEIGGTSSARFDLVALSLRLDPPDDGETVRPDHTTLPVEYWEDSHRRPTLAGAPLQWSRGEISRSLAIQPDGTRFVLGTEWFLRVFDKAGAPLWHRPAPGIVWAVNITGDGRRVVPDG